MRVLFLTTAFPAQEGDPRGNHVFQLAAQVADAGASVTVVAPAGPGSPAEEWLRGVRIRRFRYARPGHERLAVGVGGIVPNIRNRPQTALQLGPLVFQMRRMARKLAPHCDVFHAHWMYPGGLVGVGAARLAGVPIVVTAHGGDVNLAASNDLLGRLTRHVGNRTDRVLAVSQDIADKLMAIGVRGNLVEVVPLGVAPFQDVGSAHNETVRVVFVGSLIARKGVDVLLRALESVPAGLLEVELLGDGPARGELEAMVPNVHSKVVFSGEVSPSVVTETLRGADILVLPSWSEGRPVVVMEAMAAGVPVVASDIPGTRELVRHEETGLLFAPGDAIELRNALLRLARDPAKRREFGESGARSLREQGLTSEGAAARHLAIYESVIREQRMGSRGKADDERP